mmetsp:Transcript_1852/g.4156  ORF Transcript_1852/g.4156 Transcript_1852/m.4156 type:complete len:263 (+) Transcript_1852:1617-2405(+)
MNITLDSSSCDGTHEITATPAINELQITCWKSECPRWAPWKRKPKLLFTLLTDPATAVKMIGLSTVPTALTAPITKTPVSGASCTIAPAAIVSVAVAGTNTVDVTMIGSSAVHVVVVSTVPLTCVTAWPGTNDQRATSPAACGVWSVAECTPAAVGVNTTVHAAVAPGSMVALNPSTVYPLCGGLSTNDVGVSACAPRFLTPTIREVEVPGTGAPKSIREVLNTSIARTTDASIGTLWAPCSRSNTPSAAADSEDTRTGSAW